MDKEQIDRMNKTTKEAWDDNWKDIDIKTILEIFEYPRVQKFMDIIKPYLPKDGTILDVEISASRLDIDEGRIVLFIWDATDRRRIEKYLRERE